MYVYAGSANDTETLLRGTALDVGRNDTCDCLSQLNRSATVMSVIALRAV